MEQTPGSSALGLTSSRSMRSLDSDTTAVVVLELLTPASSSSCSPLEMLIPSVSSAALICWRQSGHLSLTVSSALMHSLQRIVTQAYQLPLFAMSPTT